MSGQLHQLSATELLERLRTGDLGALELVDALLARVGAFEERVGAFICLDAERVRDQARAADRRRLSGDPVGRLHGLPIAVKDNICTAQLPTSCGSTMLASYRPGFDAEAVRRLRRAGAVIIGKTNLDEFGMGSSGSGGVLQRTRNPWDLARVPGGSSGGSAAALAAGFVPLALGSDTGGSARLPASLCGVVGMMPTYGRISRHGLVPFASSLEQIGPMARTVKDCALLFRTIAGYDPKDAVSLPEDLNSRRGRGVEGLRIGLPAELWRELDPQVAAAGQAAVGALELAGAYVEEIELPLLEHALTSYTWIACSEASSNLARFDGVHLGGRADGGRYGQRVEGARGAGFSEHVKRRLLLGTYALWSDPSSQTLQTAQRMRRWIRDSVLRSFEDLDLLAMPTSLTTAWAPERSTATYEEELARDRQTVLANLAGLPALTVPCGRDAAGLPIGLQLCGAPLMETEVFAAGQVLEERTLRGGFDPMGSSRDSVMRPPVAEPEGVR